MVSVTDSICINAPRETVWSAMNDLDRKKDYVVFVQEVFNVRKLPVAQGTIYQERAKFGPKISISEWMFTEFDAPVRQVQESHSAEMIGKFTGTLQEIDSGTLLLVQMDVTLLPVFRPLGWLLEKLVVERKMKSDIATTLSLLKSLVETDVNAQRND